MGDLLEYKGYKGTVEYNDYDNILRGNIVCIDELVTYEARDTYRLKYEFKQAVDNYIKYKTPKLTGWERVPVGLVHKFIGQHGIEESYDTYGAISNILYNNANYFSNDEKANEINDNQTLWRKLKRFADEHNNGLEPDKFYISQNIDGKLYVNHDHYNTRFMEVYFSSEELAKEALDRFRSELEKHFGIKGDNNEIYKNGTL